jgi:ATP-dependent RNA helicase DeaD
MVRWAKLNIHRGKIPSLDEVEEARSNVFVDKIRATLEAKQFKPHDQMIDRLLDEGHASTDICSALIHMLQGSGAPASGAKSIAPKTKAAFGKTPAEIPPPASSASGVKPPPSWAKPVATSPVKTVPERAVAIVPPRETVSSKPSPSASRDIVSNDERPKKSKYERPARTGREPGKATIFLNVGRKDLVTPADIVGKIAGVTRLSASIVGAIDIHQRHTLADVAAEDVDFVVEKLAGIKLKGVALEPARADSKSSPGE